MSRFSRVTGTQQAVLAAMSDACSVEVEYAMARLRADIVGFDPLHIIPAKKRGYETFLYRLSQRICR